MMLNRTVKTGVSGLSHNDPRLVFDQVNGRVVPESRFLQGSEKEGVTTLKSSVLSWCWWLNMGDPRIDV